MSAPLCFLDTETTGVHPLKEVWEIGMIRRDYTEGGGYTENEVSGFVECDLANADPFGLQVGRFYERHPHGRYLSGLDTTDALIDNVVTHNGVMTRAQAATAVATMTHGAHLVGAVPSFDAGVLDPLLRACRLLPSWHYHLIDVEALAAGYIAGVNTDVAMWERDGSARGMAIGFDPRPKWDSRALYEALDRKQSEDEAHTALGDARFARWIYDTVFNPDAIGA